MNQEEIAKQKEKELRAAYISQLPPASLLERLYLLTWGVFIILVLILLVLFFKL